MAAQTRRLLLVTGMPGSGKTLVSSVARELGLPVYVMGDVIRREAARRGLEPTPGNLNMVARLLREEHGPTVVAERILEMLERDQPLFAVVDGVRSLAEVETLARYASPLILAVHASPGTRYERLRNRGRPGDPRSWREFAERDRVELSLGLGHVIALADYVLVNECSPEKARGKARRLLEALAAGETPRPGLVDGDC